VSYDISKAHINRQSLQTLEQNCSLVMLSLNYMATVLHTQTHITEAAVTETVVHMWDDGCPVVDSCVE